MSFSHWHCKKRRTGHLRELNTKGLLFQLAGAIISHSVSQKGLIGFPIIALHLYAYIVGYSDDEITLLMKKDYIPLNASTTKLHDLLAGLETCKENADIQALLEENEQSEAFWQLINSSRWPKEKPVNITTRDFLLQHLMHHELLTIKEELNTVEEFKEGLKSLGFLDLLFKNKEMCKTLLCATETQPFNSDVLKDMMLDI